MLVAVFVGFVIWFISWSPDGSSKAPHVASCEEKNTCVVRAPTTGGSFVLAATREALNDMPSAGNDRAIAVMVLNGSAFLVPQNTSVSIVDRGFGVRKVLVLEGAMMGRTGWTVADWVVDP